MGDDALNKVSDLFYYDRNSQSGIRWRVNRYGGKNYSVLVVSAGADAGCRQELRGQWKWRVCFNGRLVFCHNIVWELLNGPIPDGYVVDHFDGNTENNSVENLRLVTTAKNTRNASKRKDNSSNVTGVHMTDAGKGHTYWTASWRDGLGRKTEHFSIGKLGNDEAFRLACEYRAKMIAELNAQGAGYTADHGVREAA